jgi:hypothetical protein
LGNDRFVWQTAGDVELLIFRPFESNIGNVGSGKIFKNADVEIYKAKVNHKDNYSLFHSLYETYGDKFIIG